MRRWLPLLTTVLVAGSAASAQAETVRVQSTTDTVDAGLVDDVIKPLFAQAFPGDELSYTAVGTGAALDNARKGQADVVVTHAPSLEAKFVADGYSVEPVGRAIFYSDYVLIGPKDDPAGVFTDAPHDAIGALERIAQAGQAGKASFLSRNDNSGTNVQEELMWGLTDDAKVPKRPSSFAPTDTTRKRPGTGDAAPPWYVTVKRGQLANVLATDACVPAEAPAGGCYTMVDRGTFNRAVNGGTVTRLEVVGEKNAAGVRGGENLLINPFSVYVVNPNAPAGFENGIKPSVGAGTKFADLLTSAGFQTRLASYPTAVDPAFFADAYPLVTASPPTTAAAGSAVGLAVNLRDRLPGGTTVSGQPVTLQGSTDGTTFTDLASATTNPAGDVFFSPAIASTTSYRIVLPKYQKYSPSVQALGVVAVPVATPPGGTTTTTPPADKKAPRATSVKLTGKRLSLKASEAGSYRVTVARKVVERVKGRTRTSYKTVRTVTLKATKAQTVSKALKLKAGSYRLTIKATDRSGNTSTLRRALRVRKATR